MHYCNMEITGGKAKKMAYAWVVMDQDDVPKHVSNFYDTPSFQGDKLTPSGLVTLTTIDLPATHSNWQDVFKAMCLTDYAGAYY